MTRVGSGPEAGHARAVIECARDQATRTRLDAAYGVVTIRKLPDGVRYPFNYGYIEGTRADDGDELDVFVLGPARPPASHVAVRVVAGLAFIDARGDDPKLLAVEVPARVGAGGAPAEPSEAEIAFALSAVADFLRRYKGPGSGVAVGDPLPRDAALGLLARAQGGGSTS